MVHLFAASATTSRSNLTWLINLSTQRNQHAKRTDMLKNRMEAETAELQVTREELRRTKKDLNVMRNVKVDITEMEQMTVGHHEERRSNMQPIENLMYPSLRPASRSTRVVNAVAGPSHVTVASQRSGKHESSFHHPTPRSTDSEHDEDSYWEASRRDCIFWADGEYGCDFTRSTAQKQQNIKPLFECRVCMEKQPEDYVTLLDPCGHKFCRPCIKNYVRSKLTDHCFPILCPVCMTGRPEGNIGMVTNVIVQQVGITEQQYKKWVELEMAGVSVPLHCRKCKRSFAVDRQDLEETDTIFCPLPWCDHIWCKLCQQTIEEDGPEHSCDGVLELDRLMKLRGWKYCPSCKMAIEKAEGCNHMTCISPGCNTHFCYSCGYTIIRTAIREDVNAAVDAHNLSNCRPEYGEDVDYGDDDDDGDELRPEYGEDVDYGDDDGDELWPEYGEDVDYGDDDGDELRPEYGEDVDYGDDDDRDELGPENGEDVDYGDEEDNFGNF